MKRRDLFKLAGGALAASAMPAVVSAVAAEPAKPVARKKRKPNMLFLFTDQQRQDTLAVYGNTTIKVPNLNRLAAESVVFHNYYCTQPICTPSRGSLLTGLWPHTHGEFTNNVPLQPEIPVLVEMLQPKEYYTSYFGKWHLGNEIFRQHGFDEFESTEDIYDIFNGRGDKTVQAAQPERTRSGYYRFLVAQGQKPGADGEFSRELSNSLPIELSKPAYLADIAGTFIDENKERPWVMYVNFLDPHSPFNSAYDGMYDPEKMEIPESYSAPADPTEPGRTTAIRNATKRSFKDMATEKDLRRSKANYWGKVSLVDTMVGRILAKLAASGQAEDTIIVYTTDHGEMMGDHHLMFKSVMYQEASRVPMLVKIPGVHAHPGVQNPVSGIDVVPTLLDLLGQQLPPHLQGESWAPYLREGKSPPEKDVMIEWNGPPAPFKKGEHDEPLRTIRTVDGWKLTLSPTGEGELYNLNTDPGEKKNLYYEDASLERITELAGRVHLWQRSTGDTPIAFDQTVWTERRKKLAQAS